VYTHCGTTFNQFSDSKLVERVQAFWHRAWAAVDTPPTIADNNAANQVVAVSFVQGDDTGEEPSKKNPSANGLNKT
jgi:hypothetical protein